MDVFKKPTRNPHSFQNKSKKPEKFSGRLILS